MKYIGKIIIILYVFTLFNHTIFAQSKEKYIAEKYEIENEVKEITKEKIEEIKIVHWADNIVDNLKENLENFEHVDSSLYNTNMPASEFYKNLHLIFNQKYVEKYLPKTLDYVTREEASFAIQNIINPNKDKVNANTYKIISDFNDVSYFAKTSVEEMSAQGILKKDYNNKFNPKKYITYAEGYAIINNILNKNYNINKEQFFNGVNKTYKFLNSQKIHKDKNLGLVYFSLLDEKYNNKLYGQDNFRSNACGPTTMSMVISSLTGDVYDPLYMANWSVSNNYYVKGNGSAHSLIPDSAKAFGLKSEGLGADKNKVLNALKDGKLVVALMGKGTFTGGGHFIVLRGMSNDGGILVADSQNYEKSNKKYSIDLIVKEAKKGTGAGGPFWSIW